VARSGKTPREERRKQIRQMMLDYATEGQVSDRLLANALEVLKLRPAELRGETHKRDELLQQLFDKRLPLGEFVERWNVPAQRALRSSRLLLHGFLRDRGARISES
jgi:hypothetical protein